MYRAASTRIALWRVFAFLVVAGRQGWRRAITVPSNSHCYWYWLSS